VSPCKAASAASETKRSSTGGKRRSTFSGRLHSRSSSSSGIAQHTVQFCGTTSVAVILAVLNRPRIAATKDVGGNEPVWLCPLHHAGSPFRLLRACARVSNAR
jgi:hypothetical protein